MGYSYDYPELGLVNDLYSRGLKLWP